MAETIGSLGPGQLQEIDKWRKMGFTQGQVAKKMKIRQPLVSVAFKHLKENP
jgi:predicted transcriptional regulator